MTDFHTIASVITIIAFVLKIYKSRKSIISFLTDFRERNKETIQKIDAFIEPYKVYYNVLWESYTFIVSIFILFTGSVIAFCGYFIEEQTFTMSFIIFTLYFSLSYIVKYMGRYIKL